MSSARSLCFTLNNYSDTEYEEICNWDCKFLIVGKEIGEKGTPHLQGYVEWKSSKLFSTMKGMNSRIHWEKAKGDAQSNITYCSKENFTFSKGEPKSQGKRNDLNEVKILLDSGASMSEVADEHFASWVRYNKSFDKYLALKLTDRSDKPYVVWRHGVAGAGKTFYCIDKHPNHYIKDGTQWWDNYNQQEAIIIDDFDGKWPYRDLLRLIDRYAYQGQFKGGYVKIDSPFIYITCEFPPSHFWSGNELAQVTRRLSEIVVVGARAEKNSALSDLEFFN